MKDKFNRTYATLAELNSGDLVQTDADFTCRPPWSFSRVQADDKGPFIPCEEGQHYLDGVNTIGVYKIIEYPESSPGPTSASPTEN